MAICKATDLCTGRALVKLVEMIARREGFSSLVAEGVRRMDEQLIIMIHVITGWDADSGTPTRAMLEDIGIGWWRRIWVGVGCPLEGHTTSCLEKEHEPMRRTETAPTANHTVGIARDPQDAMAYYHRGLAHGELGDYRRAIEDFTQAIALQPQNAEAYYNRGAAYGNSGKHRQAIEDFDRAIKLSPQDVSIYVMRGFAHSALGQHDRAVGDIEQAIEVCESEGLLKRLHELRRRMMRLRR